MPELLPFPPAASTIAPRVDALYFFLVAMSAVLTLGIFGFIAYFAVRYRRRSPHEIGDSVTGGMMLEITWSVIPLMVVSGIFVWSARVFLDIAQPPGGALPVYVVGKQWMWKIQHPGGPLEINELHVPVGRDVRLTMTSQDVIHDFFIPAFRVKADVVPGRYSHLWFNVTEPGRFRLFCAEYCGANHSHMIGFVVALPAGEYERWLAGGAGEGTPAAEGRRLFQDLACDSCHRIDVQQRGPMLTNLFGSSVLLEDGSRVVADEAYLRESILDPQAKIVAGFQPIMPTFRGQVDELGVLQLIEYIRTLRSGAPDVQQPPIPPARQETDPIIPPPGGAR